MKKTLFDHQEEMVLKAGLHSKGIIQCPTGSGKTIAQAEIVLQEIQKGGFKIILVKSPRIGLSNQLAKEYSMHIMGDADPHMILAHSGNSADFEIDEDLSEEEQMAIMLSQPEDVPAFTMPADITDNIRFAIAENRAIIIFTTYHSNEKLVDIIERAGLGVTLDINDEGHYLVRQDFSTIIERYSADRQYFFTATPVDTASENGRGMNNESRFGVQIYSMPIEEAVRKGLILPLKTKRILSGVARVTQEILDNQVGDTVLEAFEAVEAEYKGIGAKLLVAVRGSKQIRNFLGSSQFRLLVSDGVHVLTVHSNPDLITHNGSMISRKDFDRIKDKIGSKLSEKMIIVHYDILSEGIDIQGLLGCLILRKMKVAKFLQTVGRVVRVLRNSAGSPSDKKRYGLLLYPDICDSDMSSEFVDMLFSLIQEGYIPRETLSEEIALGESQDEDPFGDFEEGRNSTARKINLKLFTADFNIIVADF
jgi:superfamily II DNA or RNA helicase